MRAPLPKPPGGEAGSLCRPVRPRVGGPVPRSLPRNPLLEEDCPDPAILRDGDRYYLFCTSGNARDAYPIRQSTDLASWERVGHLFPAGSRPAWAASDFWAPEVHRVGRRYVAYFTARDRTGRLCIGTACSETLPGAWTPADRPLVRDDRVGMIDSHYFQDADGRGYLYWKEDGNDLRPRRKTPIYVQRLSGDGLSLAGPRAALLENDLPWEGDLVEGPWVVRRGGWYYLFYSGNNFWEESYAVGVARAASPLGPFTKQPHTLLQRDEEWMGPGHGSIVRAHDGGDYFVYHAWRRGRVGGANPRMLLMDRIRWRNGWPAIRESDAAPAPAVRSAGLAGLHPNPAQGV